MIAGADRANFIHAHPLNNADLNFDSLQHVHTAPVAGPSPSVIRTVTGFRSPGIYKLWLQFQRNGKVFTAAWVVRVEGKNLPAPRVPAGALSVKVSAAGFEPARLTIPAGENTRIAFTRVDAQNCASEVVFPELGIRKSLPRGQTVLIDLPATPKGELHFACGMGMYRGALIVR
jgi:hypothetical protein